jgi:hypothetical protein
MKDFVPYELALELKQLGFDEECFAIWSGIDEQNFSITDTTRLYSSEFRINGTQSSKFYVNDFNSLRVAAPTYSQAFIWFRENYSIHSWIINAEDNGNVFKPFFRMRIGKDIFDQHMIDWYESYEEAELACLIKLIEIVKTK